MILLSFLSLGSAITGLVGGHKWACCLDAFLALHSIDTLCKMILVIVLWYVYLAAWEGGGSGALLRKPCCCGWEVSGMLHHVALGIHPSTGIAVC